ncbi:MAG: hypothetical protein ACQESF_06115, partial [Nanobdellota archaeon]
MKVFVQISVLVFLAAMMFLTGCQAGDGASSEGLMGDQQQPGEPIEEPQQPSEPIEEPQQPSEPIEEPQQPS